MNNHINSMKSKLFDAHEANVLMSATKWAYKTQIKACLYLKVELVDKCLVFE